MLKRICTSILLLCFFAQTKSQTAPDIHDAKFTKTCKSGNKITLEELLRQRIPYGFVDNPAILPECAKRLKPLIKNFEQEDMAIWEQLSNQYCSHKEGWVEKVPGTCDAGGPPPICRIDHWDYSPDLAAQRWSNLQSDIFNKRKKIMEEFVCSCWAEVIDAQFTKEAYDQSSNPKPQTKDPYAANPDNNDKIICYGGQCPGGYKCVNGFCVPLNPIQKATEGEASQWAINNAIQFSITEGLKKLSPIISILLEGIQSTAGAVVIGSFGYTELGLWSQGYNNEVRRIENNLKRYQELQNELDRSVRNLPNCMCRDQYLIKADLANKKKDLSENFKNLNIAYAGIFDEKEECKHCCAKTFAVYHKWFCYYYLKITL
jgi:hypothetical protein